MSGVFVSIWCLYGSRRCHHELELRRNDDQRGPEAPAHPPRARGERELSVRFLALCSHYLFEPCFARPGEGHDKGGVEARAKNVRLQHLMPMPRGASLAEIATELMEHLDAATVVSHVIS